MASAMHLPLLLLCLLVGHTHGSRPVMLRSVDDSGVSPSATTCSSIPRGFSSGNKLPVVHRLSRCSPFAGARTKQGGKPSPDEILHRDALRLRYLSDIHRSDAAEGPSSSSAPAAAPGPSTSPSAPASAAVSFPATQNVISALPGVFDYTVLAGYGTPAQPLPFYFNASGMSNLRCKPCFGGGGAACSGKAAFDPSLSSSFRTVPCGAPECRVSACSSAGGTCDFTFQNATYVFGNGTFVTDMLTLSPSAATVEDFAVGCMQVDHLFDGAAYVAAGNIDLSRSRNSLVSRLLPTLPPDTAAFSYCLPADTDAHGFFAVAPALSDYAGVRGVQYVPLVNNSRSPNFYFVDLVAVAVDGKDLPFPAKAPEFALNGTMIDAQSWFTYLNPPLYAALRDEFRRAMAQYPPAPAFNELDTCYNFTGYSYIQLPDITFKFGNGVAMDLDDRQFMYFFREHLSDDFPFGCLAFAAAQDETFPWNVLGTQLQRTKEVVYDVRGERIGFVPSRCGLR